MSRIVLSRAVFETIVKHLVDIEEERVRIIEEYYPSLNKERDNFQKLINDYICKLEDYIPNIEIKEADKGIPFVIIGSVVELEDLRCNEIERLQIISPFTNKANTNLDCASYLSPLGKEVLLKNIGDKLEIETPSGCIEYQIKGIELIEIEK